MWPLSRIGAARWVCLARAAISLTEQADRAAGVSNFERLAVVAKRLLIRRTLRHNGEPAAEGGCCRARMWRGDTRLSPLRYSRDSDERQVSMRTMRDQRRLGWRYFFRMGVVAVVSALFFFWLLLSARWMSTDDAGSSMSPQGPAWAGAQTVEQSRLV